MSRDCPATGHCPLSPPLLLPIPQSQPSYHRNCLGVIYIYLGACDWDPVKAQGLVGHGWSGYKKWAKGLQISQSLIKCRPVVTTSSRARSTISGSSTSTENILCDRFCDNYCSFTVYRIFYNSVIPVVDKDTNTTRSSVELLNFEASFPLLCVVLFRQ